MKPITIAGVTINTDILTKEETYAEQNQWCEDTKRASIADLLKECIFMYEEMYKLTPESHHRNHILGLIASSTQYLRNYTRAKMTPEVMEVQRKEVHMRYAQLKLSLVLLKNASEE